MVRLAKRENLERKSYTVNHTKGWWNEFAKRYKMPTRQSTITLHIISATGQKVFAFLPDKNLQLTYNMYFH